MNDNKYFSIEEANKTLSYVKKIVRDIIITGELIRDIASDSIKENQSEGRIHLLAENITSFINELEKIGCYYKDCDFNIGLVDFPAIIEDKKVMLCWRSDEEEIKYYHEFDSGYAGRKLIPEELIQIKYSKIDNF